MKRHTAATNTGVMNDQGMNGGAGGAAAAPPAPPFMPLRHGYQPAVQGSRNEQISHATARVGG